MGTLILQVGQCGNQVGLKLWEILESCGHSDANFLFNEPDHKAHAILIDTEPKVLRPLKEDNKKFYNFINTNNILYYQYGRGNNWAMGYHHRMHGISTKMRKPPRKSQSSGEMNVLDKVAMIKKQTKPQFKASGLDKDFHDEHFILKENMVMMEHVRDLIQKEIEKIDCYTGTMMIYSLAGGTGSGLGSRILESLKDEYDTNMVMNTVIFPNRTGETPLQHYNALLSLAHLQKFSDGVLYFQNDKCQRILNKHSPGVDFKFTNIDDINEYIASILTSVLKTNEYKDYSRFYFDILNEITAMNECKFAEVFAAPFHNGKKKTFGPEASWETVTDQCLLQSAIDADDDEEVKLENKEKDFTKQENSRNSTITSMCVMKSHDIDSSLMKTDMTRRYVEKKINNYLNPVKWNPDAIQYEYVKGKEKSNLEGKSMVLFANRCNIANVLRELSETAMGKFKAKAYLHWYHKYDLEQGDFEEAFELVNGIVDSYEFAVNN